MARPKYFLPSEVAVHNKPDDMWLSFLGKVCNLTPLYHQYKGHILLKPIIAEAGKDISHWFDPVTKDLRKHVDPITGIRKYYTPHGRFLHVPPPLPRSDHITEFGRPWWRDSAYEIGLLSQKTRYICIVNTLTLHEHVVEGLLALCFGSTPGINTEDKRWTEEEEKHGAKHLNHEINILNIIQDKVLSSTLFHIQLKKS
uniref:Cytochrome b5 domain-containing protein 1 n=1 Tax=Eptatretus burgeri TaxID=7764 RepID=A0A8C4WQ85_EPTBU